VLHLVLAVVWGGTQINWLRAVLAAGGEVLLVGYFIWVLRSLGK
jgi:hypothetical protein